MNTYTDTTSSYSANNSPTLTAFFENRDEAASAVQRLVAAGIDSANVRLVEAMIRRPIPRQP